MPPNPSSTTVDLRDALGGSRTALLTTYRRTGVGVATPVSITVEEDRAYFVTARDSGKARRLRNVSRVSLAPCTISGTAVGPAVSGRVHPVHGRTARKVLRPTRAVFWSYLGYRIRGNAMQVFEVRPG